MILCANRLRYRPERALQIFTDVYQQSQFAQLLQNFENVACCLAGEPCWGTCGSARRSRTSSRRFMERPTCAPRLTGPTRSFLKPRLTLHRTSADNSAPLRSSSGWLFSLLNGASFSCNDLWPQIEAGSRWTGRVRISPSRGFTRKSETGEILEAVHSIQSLSETHEIFGVISRLRKQKRYAKKSFEYYVVCTSASKYFIFKSCGPLQKHFYEVVLQFWFHIISSIFGFAIRIQQLCWLNRLNS